MYFHTDDPAMLDLLSNIATVALIKGQSVRIDVDDKGALKIKRGEGRWTAPFDSTPDPYRDGANFDA